MLLSPLTMLWFFPKGGVWVRDLAATRKNQEPHMHQELTLISAGVGAHPQDQFRANQYDVVDTGSSAPTLVQGTSALLSLHCSLMLTQPGRSASMQQVLVPFLCQEQQKLLRRKGLCLLPSSMPGKYCSWTAVGLLCYFFAPASLEARKVILQPEPWIFTGLGHETIWVQLSHRAYHIGYQKPSTLLLWALQTFIETAVL